jgi:sugar lactone lactonase YvrE
MGLAIDEVGSLYIADQGNNRVRRVDAKGVIATVAGSGAAGPGPGRVATKVELSAPEALAVDGQGNLYVSEFLHARVVKISRTGQLAVVAGTGIAGYSGDGRRAVVAQLSEPAGLAFDSGGNLLIADYGNRVIRKVDPAGVITTIPASVKARLHDPVGLASRGGDLYVADAGDARVVRIRASGSLSVVARRVAPAYLLLDGAAKLDMTDFVDHRIKQIDVSHSGRNGVTSLIAGTGKAGFSGDGGPATKARLNIPYGLAMDARGNLYFSDRKNNRVRRVDRHGVITTIAGSGVPGFAGDGGPATAARLNSPVGLAIDAGGNLYVADSGNNRVRRVDPHGVITTIAGG